MSRLIIHKPQLSDKNDRLILKYVITVKDDSGIEKSGDLWFSFASKYRPFICDEVCDGVVVMLLRCCIIGGHDIESELPMTDRLYYEIVHQFLPQIVLQNPGAHQVKLMVNTVCPDWRPTAVATAMSCGIDSLTTYYEHTSDQIPENYRITHLTFFEQGAHHSGGGTTWAEQDKLFHAQLAKVKTFCETIQCELIDIQSNIAGKDGFVSNLLFYEYYETVHTYRNMGFVLLLQKLIKTYYYSATYYLDQLSYSLHADSSFYEKFLLPILSTQYTTFFSTNSFLTRLEKIKQLSSIPQTYDNVLVCYKEGYNCGTCKKCWRTMLEMEVLGVLDLYKGSFDVATFRDNYEYYLTKMLLMRRDEPLMEEIYKYMMTHEIKIPEKCFREAHRIERQRKWKKSRFRRLLSKLKRKIFTNQGPLRSQS
ncbi:MAG: hypothetical protein IJJ92_04970 [Clostridia bacterium]|nr:hypothetical protein [Clostridia bacterium]